MNEEQQANESAEAVPTITYKASHRHSPTETIWRGIRFPLNVPTPVGPDEDALALAWGNPAFVVDGWSHPNGSEQTVEAALKLTPSPVNVPPPQQPERSYVPPEHTSAPEDPNAFATRFHEALAGEQVRPGEGGEPAPPPLTAEEAALADQHAQEEEAIRRSEDAAIAAANQQPPTPESNTTPAPTQVVATEIDETLEGARTRRRSRSKRK